MNVKNIQQKHFLILLQDCQQEKERELFCDCDIN